MESRKSKAEIEQFIFDPLADEKDWFVCLNGMPRKWWLAAFGLSLGHHCEVPPARVRDDPPGSSAMTDQLD